MPPICSISRVLHSGSFGFLPLSGQLSTPAAFSHTSQQPIIVIIGSFFFFLVDFSLPFDESCVVILSGCLSFSPSTIISHLPTYHVHARWEVGACRTTCWTNWRVDRMTDMVRDLFFLHAGATCLSLFVCIHVNKDALLWTMTDFYLEFWVGGIPFTLLLT